MKRSSYAHSRDKGCLIRCNTGSVCFLFLICWGNRNAFTHQALNSLWYLQFQLSSPEPPAAFATLTPLGTMGSCGSMVNAVPTSFHFASRQQNITTLLPAGLLIWNRQVSATTSGHWDNDDTVASLVKKNVMFMNDYGPDDQKHRQ